MTTTVEDLVLIELRRILRVTQLGARMLARESGMTTSQLIVLQNLKAQGEMTAGKIAQSMNLTQATVTSLLDRLQERGWILRQRDEQDRRRLHVRLSDAGRQQLERAPESLQERFVRQFGTLQPWEQTAILASLQRVAHMLDAASFDASPVLDVGRIDQDTS